MANSVPVIVEKPENMQTTYDITKSFVHMDDAFEWVDCQIITFRDTLLEAGVRNVNNKWQAWVRFELESDV